MCGFFAEVRWGDEEPLAEARLTAVERALAHRGPDARGRWRIREPWGSATLLHRRLAIIDPSPDANQPFRSRCGRWVLVYNGELYNWRALRDELAASGAWRFRTRGDTEVVLAALAHWGPGALSRLRGMFALALWDARERSLLLARDPYGIKPLYYHALPGGGLLAASEVRALLAAGVPRRLDAVAAIGMLIWGSVPEPRTIVAGIRALPAGCWLRCSAWRTRTACYLDVVRAIAQVAPRRLPAAERRERLRGAMRASVAVHLEADVPVGVFLSGGVDSAVLAATAAEVGSVEAITVGFARYRHGPRDELPGAEATARRYGLRWHPVELDDAEVAAAVLAWFERMDQPTIDGANTYLVAEVARQLGFKSVLSGLGADELFAGYPSFRQLPRLASWAPLLRHFPAVVSRAFARGTRRPKFAELATWVGTASGRYWLRRGVVPSTWALHWLGSDVPSAPWRCELPPWQPLWPASIRARTAYGAVAAAEAGWYMRNQLLRDADGAGMAHGLEIRVPFVDLALANQVAPLVAARPQAGKRWLAEVPTQGLPSVVTARRKTGFWVPVVELVPRLARELNLVPPCGGTPGWAWLVLMAYRRRWGLAEVVADEVEWGGAVPSC